MSHQPPQPDPALLADDRAHAYEQMFRASPHAMWVYDVQTLQFLDVNAAAIALYGYAREDFLSMTIADVRAEEDVPVMLEQVRYVQTVPSVVHSGPWRHRHKDGRLLMVEASSHGLVYAQRPARLVHLVDVGERLALERERVQALQALQESRERLQRALDSGGVALWERPSEIVSVTVDGTASTSFIADLNAGIVYAGTLGTQFPFGRQNVVVVYRTGAETVPASILQAARELVAHMWQIGMQSPQPNPAAGAPEKYKTPSGYLVPNRVAELCGSHYKLPGLA